MEAAVETTRKYLRRVCVNREQIGFLIRLHSWLKPKLEFLLIPFIQINELDSRGGSRVGLPSRPQSMKT